MESMGVLRTYHWDLKFLLSINTLKRNRYFTGGMFEYDSSEKPKRYQCYHQHL